MKLNKTKNYFCTKLSKPISLLVLFTSLISLNGESLKSEYLFKDLQIDSTTKTEEDSAIIPTNPFEIVEMIRRYNSMNDATNPADAIDDALKSFNTLEEK